MKVKTHLKAGAAPIIELQCAVKPPTKAPGGPQQTLQPA